MNAAKYAEQEAYDRERARIWLQDLLGLDVQSDFFSELADGVLLCSIVNTIKPGTIKKVNSATKAKKLVAKRLENLNAFLFGCKRIGVYPSYQFEIQEFQERKREDKLIRCLLKLEEIARKAGIDPSKYGEIHIGSDEPAAPPSPTPPRTSAPSTTSASASAAPPSPTVSPAKDQEAEDRERKEKERREREEREREERERAEREREEREREEKERVQREREEKEREERERREQERLEREAEEARLQREKEERERREREEREERERREAEEREERERREREERERKERAQQEAEEKKAERERKEAEEKSAREAKLRADREAREKALREERERREKEETERREREEKAKKEREEKIRRDREQREKERKEREEKEKEEKERKSAEAGAGGLKSKLDIFGGGAALKPPAPRQSSTGPSSPKSPSSPSPAEGGNARAFFSQLAGEPAKTSGGGGKLTLAPGKKLTGTDALLYWSQTNTSGYAGVDIRDFTESWRDGLGFCALVHAHFPGEIDFNACVSKSPSERLELAFDAAGRMGVPPLLDPEDITDVKSVDARSLITYLGCLYKGFKR